MKGENEAVPAQSPPGPGILSAFIGLFKVGFLDYIEESWATYGDFFRLNLGVRSLLFAIHPDAVQHINASHSKNYDKLESYDIVRKYLTGNGLLTSTGQLWRRQRRLMAPFFTPKGIQIYADIMIRDTVEIAERWESLAQSGKEVEIQEEMMRVTASIILKSMFSSDFDEEVLQMKDCVAVMIRYVSTNEQGLSFSEWVPSKRNKEYIRSRDLVHHFINRILQQRQSTPEETWPDDLLTRLMQAKDAETGESMSEELVRDESITMFFAGHETTAKTMSAAWYALAKNPEVAAKLHAELDRELGDRVPTTSDLFRLPYTLQVIKEVLRLYPAAPFYIRDAVEGDVINGYSVKPGDAIMLSPYFTHRHPDFWEDPLRFNPDRWSPEKEKARHRFCYHPFAAGKRICIGNNFSLLESQIMLAILARRFAPRLRAGFDVTWEMQGTLGTKEGFPMLIERRKI